MMQNHTYRSENPKNIDNTQLINQNKT